MDNSNFKDNRDFTCDHYTVDCACGDHSERELRENWRQCQGMRQLRNEMEEEKKEVKENDEEEDENELVDFQSKDHPTEAASSIALSEDDSSTLQLPKQSADLALQQQSTTTAAANTSGDPPIFIEEDQKAEAAAAAVGGDGDGEQLQLLMSHEAMGDIAREAAALHSNNCCCRCLKSLAPSSDFSSVDADEVVPADTPSHSESGAIASAAQEGNRLSEEAMLQAIREAVAEAMSTVVLPAIKQQQQQEQEQFSQRAKDFGDVKVEEKPPPVIFSESPLPPPLPSSSLLEVVDPSCPGCVEYLRRKKKKENQSHFAPRDWRRRLAAEEGSASSLPRDPRLNRTAELLLVHEAELRQAAHDLHAAYIRPHLSEGPLAEAVAGLLADGERLLTETVNPPLERAVERAADGLAMLASATADAVRWLADDVVLSVGDGLLATAAALRRAASTVAHQGGLIAADLIGEEVVAAAAGDLSTSASTLGSASTLEDVAKECPTGPALEQVKTTTSSSRTTPLGWLWKQVLAPPPEEQWQSNSGNGLGHWPASTGLTEWPPHHSSGAP